MRTRTTETKKEPLLKPDLYRFEEEYYREGKTLIAGCDEAGRGPLAGPVVAAAVILPPRAEIPSLNDSKKLTEKKRLALEPIIKETALYWAVARVEHDEIDEINILEASLKAMSLALDGLGVAFDVAFIDGPYVTRRGDICQRASPSPSSNVDSSSPSVREVASSKGSIETANTFDIRKNITLSFLSKKPENAE